MDFKRIISVLIGVSVAANAYGADCRRSNSNGDNPYPKGTGRLVGGIVTTAAAVPIALVAGLVVGYSNADCGHSGEDEPNCRREGRGYTTGAAVAGVVAAAGITAGVLTIRSGKAMRNQYYEWEEQCRPQDTKDARAGGLSFERLSVEPTDGNGIQMGLSWNF